MVIGEGDARCQLHAGRFQPLKKLLGPRDSAKCHHRSVDVWHFHAPPYAPHRSLKSAGPRPLRNLRLVRWYGENASPLRCAQCLAQISRGQEMIAEVSRTEQQNVYVAMELAMLKPIIEKMQTKT